jgi:Fe-Mn family superoxide dismutase
MLISLDDLNTLIHLQPAIRFNGGGHINHAIFWQILSPKEGGNQPTGAIAEQIKKDFGSFDKMVTQLSNASVGVQGSGWGWLGYNKQDQRLQIATCSNQDPLQATTGKIEEKYFLRY